MTQVPHEPHGGWYRVGPADTVQSIATRFGSAIDDIEELNGVDRRQSLIPGACLFIAADHVALPMRTNAIAACGVPAARKGGAASGVRQPTSPSVKTPRVVAMLWPVPGGVITSRFGKRNGRNHEGIDIAAKQGTPVLATLDGVVIYAGSGLRGYGNLVAIRHAGKLVSVYAHNKRNLVRENQTVRRGEIIAEIGQTGRATGPHLHFEIRVGETPTDPLKYVSAPRR